MDYQSTSPLKPNFFNNPVLQSRWFIIFVIICVLAFFALGIAGDYYLKTGSVNNSSKITPIPTLSKIKNKTDYSCPENGWVNCMPILTGEAKKLCQPEAINWYIANCPGFKGIAQ